MSEEREWSVVMTGFSGVYWDFVEAAREAFGREDFDASGPAVFPDSFLPAELASGLKQQEAERIVERLGAAGADVRSVRSADLPDVRHRAQDFWCIRCVGDMCFSEIEGLITVFCPTTLRDGLAQCSAEKSEPWHLESFFNHFHLGFGDQEEAVVEGREMVDALKDGLKQAYPDRSFTIAHWLGDEVSFWQTTPDSPREPEEGQELLFIEPVSSRPC